MPQKCLVTDLHDPTKEMTKDSNLSTLQVKGSKAFNKQAVEIYILFFQFVTDLPTGLCTENNINTGYTHSLLATRSQPCAQTPDEWWINAPDTSHSCYPHFLPWLSTDLRAPCQLPCQSSICLIYSDIIGLSTENALPNNSSSNP